jgi:hypothetical protein
MWLRHHHHQYAGATAKVALSTPRTMRTYGARVLCLSWSTFILMAKAVDSAAEHGDALGSW